MALRHPLVIAHRGACGYRPEHTAAAYRLALDLGADAVEPDLVATRDGVLVIRHENEISGTTDVADRAEFADRRTTRTIDGERLTGWFTEDFTWEELQRLRCRERIPQLRPGSAAFDGWYPMLRLRDLLALLDGRGEDARPVALVAELKHPTHFASLGLPLDELLEQELDGWGTDESLIVESFEQSVLGAVRARGLPGRTVFLLEGEGAPADLVARDGARARSYADHLTPSALAELAGEVHGISLPKRMLLRADGRGAPEANPEIVDRAHTHGLDVYCWTLRAESRFLPPVLRRGDGAGAYGDWATEFSAVLASGVDGVFADQPDLVRALLDARGG